MDLTLVTKHVGFVLIIFFVNNFCHHSCLPVRCSQFCPLYFHCPISRLSSSTLILLIFPDPCWPQPRQNFNVSLRARAADWWLQADSISQLLPHYKATRAQIFHLGLFFIYVFRSLLFCFLMIKVWHGKVKSGPPVRAQCWTEKAQHTALFKLSQHVHLCVYNYLMSSFSIFFTLVADSEVLRYVPKTEGPDRLNNLPGLCLAYLSFPFSHPHTLSSLIPALHSPTSSCTWDLQYEKSISCRVS